MAIITKPDESLFASTAQLGEVETYPDIGRGFGIIFEMFQGIPPMEMFNHLLKRLDEKDMYLWQQGIPDWSATIDYPQYALTKKNGKIYVAAQSNTNIDPASSGNSAYWELLLKDLDMLLNVSPRVVASAPTSKLSDVIYAKDKTCFMKWQTIGSWTGYASDGVMDLVIGTTIAPKPNEIDLIGGTYSKAKYPALWAKAQANGHVIVSSAWRAGMFKFVDLGGDNFKVPDLRNMFIRGTGTDADSANARELGSYQQDAMQRIAGAIQAQSDSGLSGVPIVSATSTGALNYIAAGMMPYSTTSSNSIRMYSVHFDSGLVARTSTETRTSNTAFHLRLCAY